MASAEDKHPDSFHASIRPLLLMGRVCGLVPVTGIFESKLSFSWSNNAHAYALVISLVTLYFDSCYTIDNLKTAIRIDVFASTVFYTVCLLTTFFFLQIAKNFGSISEDFAKLESRMSDYNYPRHLGRNVKLFLAVFTVLAIMEHGTMVVININLARKLSAEGRGEFGFEFYHAYFPAIAWRLPYSGLGTLLLLWVNSMCTFNWNYLDFFLIVMSMEISSRFTLINNKLKKVNIDKQDFFFWEKISRDYNEIAVLTKKVDRHLAKVILTSFFSNLYHLSLQLVRSLKLNGTLFQMTYFYFSLGYLVIRLLLVLYFAAKINEESRKPSADLFLLKDPCPQAIRFLHQMTTDEIALTGNRFFVIDKKFVASVIGTIVTYQGALLQFNSLSSKESLEK